MLKNIQPLVAAGCSCHWLHPKTKRPIGDDWSKKPVWTVDQLRASYREGMNSGVRLGEPSRVHGLYLHVFDVDIRDPDQADDAFDALAEYAPEFEDFPTVASGSGGESRHFYFLTDRPFRGVKLAHSDGAFVDDEGKKHWEWEVELFGTGKQVVLPPSIHPDTGQPYRWVREFDFDLVEMGLGPIIDSSVVAQWAPADQVDDLDDDDLLAYVKAQPTDLTDKEVGETLALLPLDDWCEDRDGWVKVGMGLHHQYEGSDKGYELWVEFSKQSKKFNPKDQKAVWKSFKTKSNGASFRTLIQAANAERVRRREEEEDLIGEAADEPASAESDEIEDLIGGAEADPDAPTVGWKSLLEWNAEKTAYKPTLHNTVLIVRNDARTKGLPALNEFTQEVVQRGTPGRHVMDKKGPKGVKQLSGPVWSVEDKVNGSLWTNRRDVAVREVLEAPNRQGGYGIKLSDRDLRGAIDLVAVENKFHPVREYLTTLKWDGTRRVDQLFVDYLGAPNTSYTRSVARMFLVAAVTRVFEPGHKFDFAPILEGLQGKRKSTFIRILARSWFSELDGDIQDTKAMVEAMQGSWILEIPELSGFSKSEVNQIKAFISRQTDKVRLAYERRAEQFPRQNVFMGSTNDDVYLRDDTGARRFWPVRCDVDEIDTERLEREIDQVWAEAYQVYRTMRKAQPRGALPLYLVELEAKKQALAIQESRRVESAEDGISGQIEAWLEAPIRDESGFDDEETAAELRNEICLLQIWVECMGRDGSNYGQAQSQQLGRAMKKVQGWRPEGSRRTDKYGFQRVYRRAGYRGPIDD